MISQTIHTSQPGLSPSNDLNFSEPDSKVLDFWLTWPNYLGVLYGVKCDDQDIYFSVAFTTSSMSVEGKFQQLPELFKKDLANALQ